VLIRRALWITPSEDVFADRVSSIMLHCLLARDKNVERNCRIAVSWIQKTGETFYIYSSLRIGLVDATRCPYWLEARDVALKPLKKVLVL
jgi:hypothetical protein